MNQEAILSEIQFFEQIKYAMANRKPKRKVRDILVELGIEWVEA
jgi:hypothetical protein